MSRVLVAICVTVGVTTMFGPAIRGSLLIMPCSICVDWIEANEVQYHLSCLAPGQRLSLDPADVLPGGVG